MKREQQHQQAANCTEDNHDVDGTPHLLDGEATVGHAVVGPFPTFAIHAAEVVAHLVAEVGEYLQQDGGEYKKDMRSRMAIWMCIAHNASTHHTC